MADWGNAQAIEPVFAEVQMVETAEVSKATKEVAQAMFKHGLGQVICKMKGLLIPVIHELRWMLQNKMKEVSSFPAGNITEIQGHHDIVITVTRIYWLDMKYYLAQYFNALPTVAKEVLSKV